MNNVAMSNSIMERFPANAISIKRRKSVFGVGVNDSIYMVHPSVDGKRFSCPAHSSWRDMLRRSYSPAYHLIEPTYSEVTVCADWLRFTQFRHWWIENQVDGWQLDKDILSDSKTYSPKSCIFVPQWLNAFTTDHRSSRGDQPIGVHLDKRSGKYIAQCSNVISGRQERLGSYDSPLPAHNAWLNRKMELACELRPRMDSIDLRIYPRIVEIINRISGVSL